MSELDPGRAVVAGEYVLTPMDADADARLAEFVLRYPAFIAGWAEDIDRYLSHAAGSRS